MLKNCTIYRYTIHEVKSSTPECLIPIPTVTIPLGHGSLQNAIYLHIPPIAEVRSLIFLNDIKIAGGKKKKYKWIFTRGNAESPVWLGVLERTKLKTKNRSELLLINYMWQLKRIKGTKLCHDNKNKHININKTIKVDRTEWWRNSKLLHTLTCTRITNDPAGKVTVVNPTIYF